MQRKWSCEDVLVGRGTLHLLCKRGKGERSVGWCLHTCFTMQSECYMSDVPSPFKKELSEYNEREERMLSMIYEKFLGSDTEEKMQECD